MDQQPPHVVIIGGGFGGINAAQALRRAPVRVTLIDRRNFHLFQPLLYQVATGALSPANIAAPLRGVLRKNANTQVLLGEVSGIDAAGRRVLVGEQSIPYDTLIVATGSTFNYFGHPEWEPIAPGLKTIEDSTHIRARVLTAFEMAEGLSDPSEVPAWLTFVIVGGGPTGVEMAGALAEVARHTLKHDFRAIRPQDTKIILLEAQDRVLGAFPVELSARAAKSLERLGVTVRTGARVTDIREDHVTVRDPQGQTEVIPAHTVIWTAGVKASSLTAALKDAAGAELDSSGRVLVAPDLTVPGRADIFVIGDMAHAKDDAGQPLPGLAPVAMQQGRYVASVVKNRLRNKETPPFRYRNRGTLATIGRAAAVADFGWLRISGVFAWLMWLFVHLMYLVQFQNRILVLVQWAWNYVTHNRSARLITGSQAQSALEKATSDSGGRSTG